MGRVSTRSAMWAAWFAAIAFKGVCERVKILAGDDVLLRQTVIDLVAGVFVAVEDHRVVGVVEADARGDAVDAQAGDADKISVIALGDGSALVDLPVQVPQVADAHGGAELVHLGVAAHIGGRFRPVDAEVFQVAQPLQHLRAPHAHRPALDGVEDLGGVEGEHGRVPEIGGADAVFLHGEGVGRIVDDGQAVLFRKGADGVHVAEISVDVHRHNGDGFVGDERLDLCGVHGEALRVNVAEHRRAAAAHDGMGGGGEGEGRGDDLPMQIKGLDHIFQRQMAVGEERQILAAEKALKLCFQRPVLDAHVGQPVAVPELADLRAVFLKVRHGRAGHIDNCHLHSPIQQAFHHVQIEHGDAESLLHPPAFGEGVVDEDGIRFDKGNLVLSGSDAPDLGEK